MPTTTAADQFLRHFGDLVREIDRCIRCGYCNSACPTSNVESAYRESYKSRGRLVMLQSLRERTGGISPYAGSFKHLINMCFACQRCVPICPASIPIPDLMVRARYAYREGGWIRRISMGERILANYHLLERIGSELDPISNVCIRSGIFRWVMGLVTGIAPDSPLPNFRRGTFSSWFQNRNATKRSRRIVYVPEAYAEYNRPDLARLAVELLETLGFEVIVPSLESTGLPAIEFGFLDQARRIANRNINVLYPFARRGLPIVSTTPAVPSALKSGYGNLLNGDDMLATVAAQTHDIHEFILGLVEAGKAKIRGDGVGEVLYHYCCLSKSLQTLPSSKALLTMCGFRVSVAEECCGGAGVWGMLKKNRPLSMEVGAPLFRKARGAQQMVTESETCKLQIESASRTQVVFPIELIAPRISAV